MKHVFVTSTIIHKNRIDADTHNYLDRQKKDTMKFPEIDLMDKVAIWILMQGLRVTCSMGYGLGRDKLEHLREFISREMGMECFVHSGKEVVVTASPLSLGSGDFADPVSAAHREAIEVARSCPRFAESYASFLAWAEVFGFPRLSEAAFNAVMRGIPAPNVMRSALKVSCKVGHDPKLLWKSDVGLLEVYHQQGDAQHDAHLRDLMRIHEKLRGQVFTSEKKNCISFEDAVFYWDTTAV